MIRDALPRSVIVIVLLCSSAPVLEETLAACPATYAIETVLPAPHCSSVDVSPDRRGLYAHTSFPGGDDGFRVFDLTSGDYDVIAEYEIPGVPWTGLVSWDHQHLWMTRYYGGDVLALNLTTGEFDCELDLGSWTEGLAFDSLRRYLYVGENCAGGYEIGSVVKIDVLLCSETGCSELGRATLNGEPSTCIQVGFGDQYVYVISHNPGSETLYKIRTSDMQIDDALPLYGIGNPGFSLSPDGRTAYVPHAGANLVYVIDTVSMLVTDAWPLGDVTPEGFFVSPDGTHALIIASEPIIRVFDLEAEAIGQIIVVEGIGDDIAGHEVPPYWDCKSHTVYVPLCGSSAGVVVLKETCCPGDLDCDGDVDLSDLAILLAHYGETCP